MSDTGSILSETKQTIGIEPDNTEFDVDIIMQINSAFFELNQMNVGPKNVFAITDKDDKWNHFTTESYIATVKSFIWAAVRISFDPPSTSFGLQAVQDLKKELGWRLHIAGENND